MVFLMKKVIYTFVLLVSALSFSAFGQDKSAKVQVTINLNTISNDKVMVSVVPPKIVTDKITYYIPKTVPGTYSTDNPGNLLTILRLWMPTTKP